MIHFRPLPLQELTAEDIRLLVKLTRTWYGGQDPAGILDKVADGRLTLWRLDGEATGLLLTVVKKRSTGQTLWVEGLVGVYGVKRLRDISSSLQALAKKLKCQSFSFQTQRKGMLWVAEELGLEPRAWVFEKEVD